MRGKKRVFNEKSRLSRFAGLERRVPSKDIRVKVVAGEPRREK